MANNPKDNSELVALQSLSTALIRSEALFQMTTDYLTCSLQKLITAPLQGLTDSKTLSALDLYGKTVSESLRLIDAAKIDPNGQIQFKKIDKICDGENPLGMSWDIKSGDSITLLIDSDVNVDGAANNINARVLGVQKQQSNPIG
jgi:hypothetical protein